MLNKKKIKQALVEAGLTQEELAKILGVTAPTVNSYINRKSQTRPSTLKKIAKATGKDISYFFASGGISQSANNSTNIRQTINNADMEFIKDSFKKLELAYKNLETKLDLLLALNKIKRRK